MTDALSAQSVNRPASNGSGRPPSPGHHGAFGVRWLRHGRCELALHELRSGAGRPLLLLHGLGEHAGVRAFGPVDAWPGPVFGLDFTGHGASTLPTGGGYTSELLVSDADVALSELGGASVVGRGLGAYVALLLAGARPDRVNGVVLADGPGLTGGGIQPPSPVFVEPTRDLGTVPDPFALMELARDVRPPDYAAAFARFALEGSPAPDPIIVSAVVRPEWLAAVSAEPGVVQLPLDAALHHLAQHGD